jgi:hypothetical protein
MQEPHSLITSPDDTKHAPLHSDIAQCAQELWVKYGKPADRDLAIWLEAEHQLSSVSQTAKTKNSGSVSTPVRKQAKASRH